MHKIAHQPRRLHVMETDKRVVRSMRRFLESAKVTP